MNEIIQRINSLSRKFTPLKNAALRYVDQASKIDRHGTLLLGHRPWVAPENYMLFLYPGIDPEALERCCNQLEIEVPSLYAEFLSEINGAFLFGMSLFGIPKSMMGNPPMLNRSSLQCHCLSFAVTDWVRQYRLPFEAFHFGSRHYSSSENVGYFLNDSLIYCIRKNGEIIGQWRDLTSFLDAELAASENYEKVLHPRK